MTSVPVQMRFHNMAPSATLEAEIQRRVAQLERFSDRLVHCQVDVAAPHDRHGRGHGRLVGVTLTIPGEVIVVRRDPSTGRAPADATAPRNAVERGAADRRITRAIHEAFDAARRTLQDHVRRQRHATRGRAHRQAAR